MMLYIKNRLKNTYRIHSDKVKILFKKSIYFDMIIVSGQKREKIMIEKLVEELLHYSKINLNLKKEDTIYIRNLLLRELNLSKLYEGEIDKKFIDSMQVPDQLVNQLEKYLSSQGLSASEIEAKIAHIFGLLSPLPSNVIHQFNTDYLISPSFATNNFFDLCIKNNYVQKTKIEQNVVISSPINGHDLIVTINLSKPEKSNKDIKLALANKSEENYPKCAICIENEGCKGSNKTAPRGNLRLIPLRLNNDNWYLQYSPYGYYNEHCIVISEKHVPMEVNENNLKALYDFVDIFPHYFLGANSDLPIVGGSILSHEHFQGGNYELPLMRAKTKYNIPTSTNVDVSILDWPTFVLKLESTNKKEIIDLALRIHNTWKTYNDETVNIISKTSEQHNTTTNIVKKVNNKYVHYLILRNNRTTDELPGGLFHVRPSLQIIKNEGIGLIEALGLFIFPPRLKRQLKEVSDIIANPSIKEETYLRSPDIKEFDNLINDLLQGKYKDIDDLLIQTGEHILEDISVFKNDELGNKAKERFIKKCAL